MKRTENIQKDAFRKGWRSYRLAPVALAISAAFILAGCEQTDETVLMYQNVDDCSVANPSMGAQCTTAYNNALKEAEKTAPKYASKEDCVAEFGEAQCTPVPAQAATAAQPTQTSSSWMPLIVIIIAAIVAQTRQGQFQNARHYRASSSRSCVATNAPPRRWESLS